MTQLTALIVHSLLDAPDQWREVDTDHISDGYYAVWFSGQRYGVGASSYQGTASETEILGKAIKMWKAETGWVPPEERKPAPNMHERDRTALELASKNDFIRAIRSCHRSYKVHGEVSVLDSAIQKAIESLDGGFVSEGKKDAGSS